MDVQGVPYIVSNLYQMGLYQIGHNILDSKYRIWSPPPGPQPTLAHIDPPAQLKFYFRGYGWAARE